MMNKKVRIKPRCVRVTVMPMALLVLCTSDCDAVAFFRSVALQCWTTSCTSATTPIHASSC